MTIFKSTLVPSNVIVDEIALEGLAILAHVDCSRGGHARSTWLPWLSAEQTTDDPAGASLAQQDSHS